MPAPKGNRFWEARAKHGRDKIFQNPEILWKSAVEYFEWVEENPLMAAETVKFQGEAKLTEVPKMRAMTIDGLCLFLDIARKTWFEYKAREDFLPVIERIESVIYFQKFSGAAADLLNANIIARDLGLRDKIDTEHSGVVGLSDMSEENLDRKLAELLQRSEQAGED